ncbi:MAG: T9SS type A sorting domain-containing protein, partial [Bacteroidota bacterium]
RDDITTEELQASAGSYVYFCSRNYVWVVNGAFGDGLQVKWNRITAPLVDGLDEVFTAMTVANDAAHTIYIGTSRGNVFRITGANDLKSYDAQANVRQFDLAASNLRAMEDRWITDIAVDPTNTNRIVLTYAGYGGNVNAVPSNVWATDSANLDNPPFNFLGDASNATPLSKLLTYSAAFVEDGDSSVLVLGTEKGLVVTSIADIFNIPGVPPIYVMGDWIQETAIPQVPVYDIFVRNYKGVIREKALTRVVDGKEVPRDNFVLSRDQEVYLATHGAGIWTSSSFQLRKGRTVEEPLPISDMNISLYPNPNNGQSTTVEVELTGDTEVQISMFDLSGRQIDRQFYPNLPAGTHTMSLDVKGLTSGLYLVKVQLKHETETLNRTFKSMIVH